MSEAFQLYEKIKEFVAFDDTDAANLKLLQPVFAKHGDAITDGFYSTLQKYPETAAIIEGRVDSLKATHKRWMSELVAGDYGEDYFNSRMVIGAVHVRVGIQPYFVEATMDVIRTEGAAAVFQELEPDQAVACVKSLLKICDLDLLVINMAYGEERLDRLQAFTGFSRKLIENCISKAKK